ncbi:NTE family protein [Jatrophihabitans sp. GAS493]|uniref:patatin-like phospholipase family protein n=1 Tax=Jatrophihabitans sp. GAS493 TaxID=1907575 RepID=UPI000BB91DDD|nr:patatin-like phospholipase family protein [Jatrophihabitans sp. GAS493]SOD73153.1 NTE family protein [Jatrophihabitans sp. GAS493]
MSDPRPKSSPSSGASKPTNPKPDKPQVAKTKPARLHSVAPMPPARPSRAIVLGSGGVLGFAWMLGALGALEVEAEFRAHEVDIIVGTSAGSVGAALLSCGITVDQIRRHHQGVALPTDPPIAFDHDAATGGGLPRRPGVLPGSPQLLLNAVRHPRRVRPIVTLSGVLPAGRGTLRPVTEMVSAVAADQGFDTTWPNSPRPWIAASDYTTGQRVLFGRDDLGPFGDPQVSLSDAVTASCSIPAWYPPVQLGSHTFIDGGAISNASVDILADVDVDEVYVFAPMASVNIDRRRSPVGRIERAVRRSVTRGVLSDVEALRASGKRVALVTPEPTDLEVIGLNLMNPRRRSEVLEVAKQTASIQLRQQLAARSWSNPREAGAGFGRGSARA